MRNAADAYDQLYAHYSVLHDTFGRGTMMHELRRPSRGKRRTANETIADLRRLVCDLHAELPKHGLVVWTSGNLSARVPGEELMVIKASGVDFEAMTPETVVVCDLFGELVEGELAPSSDAATHGYVYRHMPEIGGVAHTHSAYATAFAARGEPIPCVLTAIADEFGGAIPIGPVRANRRRGDRPRDRRDSHGTPVTGGAHAQSRCFHVGRNAARCDQGGGHV